MISLNKVINKIYECDNKVINFILDERKTFVITVISYLSFLALIHLYRFYTSTPKTDKKNQDSSNECIKVVPIDKKLKKEKVKFRSVLNKRIEEACNKLFEGSKFNLKSLSLYKKIIDPHSFHSLNKCMNEMKDPVMKCVMKDQTKKLLCIAIKIHTYSAISSRLTTSVLVLHPYLKNGSYIWRQLDYYSNKIFLSDPSSKDFYGNREIPYELKKIQTFLRTGNSENPQSHNWLLDGDIWKITHFNGKEDLPLRLPIHG